MKTLNELNKGLIYLSDLNTFVKNVLDVPKKFNLLKKKFFTTSQAPLVSKSYTLINLSDESTINFNKQRCFSVSLLTKLKNNYSKTLTKGIL